MNYVVSKKTSYFLFSIEKHNILVCITYTFKKSVVIFGGNSEKVTPVPIPNTEVKLLSAENTWWVTAREHKTLPKQFCKRADFCLPFCRF